MGLSVLGMACSGAGALSGVGVPSGRQLPNIVYILADDMGYGDVSCLNPKGKIPTPNIDRLAKEGILFTDAHAGSAACTPTRYGVMTGRYCWRTRQRRGVLRGFSPPLIEKGRLTVPALLRRHGYSTAMFGKWHLGMTMPTVDGKKPSHLDNPTNIAWSKPIRDTPLDYGFDVFFGTAASLDLPPYGWIEGDRFTAPCTQEGTTHRCVGPMQEDFKAVEVLPTITRRTVEYIASRRGKPQPFFLYMAITAPHEPLVPAPKFAGKSPLGPYGDLCMQVDDTVGQVCNALAKAGLARNTWVIFAADNGCSRLIDVDGMARKGHLVSGGFRGYKAEIYEGGDRVPYVMRWPAAIAPGRVSAERVCLTDLLATCAELVGEPLPPNAGEDSVGHLALLLGRPYPRPLREAIVHHSADGSLGITKGQWKLGLCRGTGGWYKPYPPGVRPNSLPPVQLYNIVEDPKESRNLQAKHPEIVRELKALLRRYETSGRSAPLPSARPQ